jgi:hypothetical protein
MLSAHVTRRGASAAPAPPSTLLDPDPPEFPEDDAASSPTLPPPLDPPELPPESDPLPLPDPEIPLDVDEPPPEEPSSVTPPDSAAAPALPSSPGRSEMPSSEPHPATAHRAGASDKPREPHARQ